MKLVFLDFDGVLCNRESISIGYKARTSPEQDPYGAHPDCVAALNRIIKETGAVIVVSSTWRRGSKTPRTAMSETLGRWGVKGTVIGVTPALDTKTGSLYLAVTRGAEIQAWLDSWTRCEIEAFTILDDDADMGALAPYLVRTQFDVGLTMEDASRTIAMLNG